MIDFRGSRGEVFVLLMMYARYLTISLAVVHMAPAGATFPMGLQHGKADQERSYACHMCDEMNCAHASSKNDLHPLIRLPRVYKNLST